MATCDQCGSTERTHGVLGLEVCSACGAVRSFTSTTLRGTHEHAALRQEDTINIHQGSTVFSPPLLKVQATSKDRASVRVLIVDDAARRHRIQRCKEAIAILSSAVRIQDTVREPALALLLKHCQRISQVPSKGRRLKKLVCACVLAVSCRQGLGLTIHEVAAQAELPVSEVQRSVWRVCKVNGVRLVRSQENLDALLHRVCDFLQLRDQRGAVCAAASRIMAIATEGWITTGRAWAFVVCACLLLALRAYHFSVTPEQVGRAVCIGPHTIERRVCEIKRIILSLCQTLPWGHLVDPNNVHVYLLFVVDFFDVLRPVAAKLAEQAREQEERRGAMCSRSEGAVRECCEGGVCMEPLQ